MKLLSTIITVLFLTLSFGVKSHSQIEIFGLSFAMSDEEILTYLFDSGYGSNYNYEYGLPVPCVQNGRVLDHSCFVDNLSSPMLVNYCKSQINKVKKCLKENREANPEDVKTNCSSQYDEFDKCDFDYLETINSKDDPDRIAVYLASGNDDYARPGDDSIDFQCGVFNGCKYSEQDIIYFLIDEIGDQLVRSADGKVETHDDGRCMTGLEGDQICVERFMGDNWITLIRDRYGDTEMTLSLN